MITHSINRIFDIPAYQLCTCPLENAFSYKKNNLWVKTSTKKYVEDIQKASQSLLHIDIKKGDKIAIISNNITQWNIIDMAISQIGGISVPIYPNLSSDTYKYIFEHAEIKACFLENRKLVDTIIAIREDLPTLEHIFTFDKVEDYHNWESFLKLGENISIKKITDIAKDISQEDIATISYTSGTTDKPKGVILTHKNLISNILYGGACLELKKYTRALSFLPISHAYERVVLYIYQMKGISIHYAQSLETIGKDAKEVKPHIITSVPRMLEKMYAKILDKGKELVGIKKLLFFWAVSIGLKHNPYKFRGLFHPIFLYIARVVVFKKWKAALGGYLKVIGSGSAPLESSLIRLFYAVGFKVVEGYGLSEAAPIVSVNRLYKSGFKLGSVGKAIPFVKIKIDNEGEVLVKGPNVMKGYYKDEVNTQKTIDKEGYLHTGDIGSLDKNGFLKIVDRKKEIFKISSGKYICPQSLENAMKSSRFIEYAMVVGEWKKYPSALIQIDFNYTEEWCKKEEISIHSREELVKNREVIKKIKEEIRKNSIKFNPWEQVKNVQLVSIPWTIEAGELTPTLKLKRRVIAEKHRDIIENIYSNHR